MDRSYAESNEQGCITIGRLGRVIEATWEHPELPDGSYNYQRGNDAAELFDLFDDGEEPLARPLPGCSTLKRTLCVNAPVQGACADAAMGALTLVDTVLQEAGIDGGPVLFLHDEIVLEVPERDAEKARTLLVEAMERAFVETFPDASLNGMVETRIAGSWGPRESNEAKIEPTAGDAGGSELPAGELPSDANGGDANPAPDQRGRAAGRRVRAVERVDVHCPDTSLIGEEPEDKGEPKSEEELATSLLTRVCDRCGASPCKAFGATTTFCTLECWHASHVAQ
jgi:hypothetical protein